MVAMYVGVTDGDWFRFLSQRPDITEVNFWQPVDTRRFGALTPGELFLFKLKAPNNFIVGLSRSPITQRRSGLGSIGSQ